MTALAHGAADGGAAAAAAPGFPGGITVLMAVYARDDADLFAAALASVYQGTLPPDDVLLVVDGPVPGTLRAIAERYQAERGLRVLWSPENGGLARALNLGLAEVRTEWVARADADDRNLPDRLERQARALAEAGGALDLLGGAILEVDRAGAPLALRKVPLDAAAIARRLPVRNPFNHMTVVYRASLVRAAGGYPELPLREDYGLWAALLARGARCRNLGEVLVRATAGPELWRRRGGAAYARSEWRLQRHLVRLGCVGRGRALLHWALRAGVACLPSRLRGWLYRGALRARPEPASQAATAPRAAPPASAPRS